MRIQIILVFLAVLLFSSFEQAVTDAFTVDTKTSSIKWMAGKIGGSHEGTLRLSSGVLNFNGSNLVSGSFHINMQSIIITDLKGTANQSLLNHLKGEHFFSVEKHPVSTFQITKVDATGTNAVNITGNLNIKGITKTITFPAQLKRQKNTVSATATGIRIDRTQYDIKYRSKSFFGDVGDKAIDDEFILDINLVAKR